MENDMKQMCSEYFGNEPILVAGASGCLGRNLFNSLKSMGLNVHGTCNSKSIEGMHKCDMMKQDEVTNLFEAIRPAYVFVTAFKIGGIAVMKSSPSTLVRDNVVLSANLIESAHKYGVKKLQYISSSTIYQESYKPLLEDELDMNKEPYPTYLGVGWVKRYAEKLCMFYNSLGLPVSIIRTTAIYGKYEKYGEGSHFTPATVKKVIEGQNPLVIWGSGHSIRNMIYVDDLVRDMLIAFVKKSNFDVFNVVSDNIYSIRDVVNAILVSCKSNLVPVYDCNKPEAIPYRDLSRSKFDAHFGKQVYTPLNKGIDVTVEWIKGELEKSTN